MKFILFLLRLVFCFLATLLLLIPIYITFYPIFSATHFIIPYAVYPFDICTAAPIAWKYIKIAYCISSAWSCWLFSNSIYSLIFKDKIVFNYQPQKSSFNKNSSGLNLYIGKNSKTNIPIYLNSKSLYQNMLITGTIGTGKTSSSMYPFAKQLISYHEHFGMLILDVKGNFYKQVKIYAQECGRLDDLYVIELGGAIKYNPLDKPDLKPSVLANRLKTILTLFSPNNSESYWLDKAEEVLTECIKLCRIYNNGYVTFTEIHKLVNSPTYYDEKIKLLRQLFISRSFRNTSNTRFTFCSYIF